MSRTILSGYRILVVDDNEDSLEVTGLTLEVSGAGVQMARSVEEALVLLRGGPPSVLVSDLSMPGEDGYSLCRRLRALPAPYSTLPAVALSGFASEADRVAAREAGFTIHLAKPVEPAHLVAVVASLAERARAANDLDEPTLPPCTVRTSVPPSRGPTLLPSQLQAALGFAGDR